MLIFAKRNSMKKNDQEKILETANAFRKSRILLTAVDLNIFFCFFCKKLDKFWIVEKTQTDPDVLYRLLNALCALDFLIKEKEEFMNTPIAEEFLVKGKPGYLSNLHHTNHLWCNWSELTNVIKKGKPSENEKVEKRDRNWLEAFIEAMDRRGLKQAPLLAKNIDLTSIRTVLDVGGGSGVFSRAMIHEKPEIKATIFDLPDVIQITEEYILQHGLKENMRTKSGNYRTDTLGTGYDLVLLSAIIHMNSDEENLELIKKCYQALNKQGIIIIQDFIMENNRIEPKNGAFFAINMLVGTEKGNTYTENEIAGWLTSAGFNDIERIHTSYSPGIMKAKK